MLYIAIYLFPFLANLLLAFLVLRNNRNSKLHRTFFWLPISASAWILSLYLFYFHNFGIVLFFGRINFVFAELIAYFAFSFGYLFPKETYKINNKLRYLIKTWLVFLICITLFSGLIDKNEVVTNDGVNTVYGSLYYLFILHFVFFFSLLIILPLIKYKKLDTTSKHQVSYLLVGAFLTLFFSSITNIILPLIGYYNGQNLGPLSTLFLASFITYAIVKHRLMDIKLVMRQYFVMLLSLATIIIPAVFIIRFYETIVPQSKIWVDLAILFLAIYFFPICRDFFYRFANKYLFSSLYDSAEVIAGLSDKLRSTLNPLRIYDFIYDTLNGALHFKVFGVLEHNEKTTSYNLKYNRGFNAGGINFFDSDEALHSQYITQNKPIILDELKFEKNSKFNKQTKQTLEKLKQLSIAILVPLNVKDKTIGLLALGDKESNDIYNDEDLKMLEVVSAQAAIAIENATLYEEAKQFNVKLEEEVKKATRELIVANDKLKKLDESKSEFISIASHQLRTPLTVIKGYVSMILENSFGKISAVQRDSLDKVYQSNERLISLVENLLNLSRIESGRLQFKYETMNLETVVASVVDELSSKAKEKKLKLEYKHPAKSLPLVTIDQEKIRQVIMNLVDNAIKYTAKGSITVNVRQAENNIEFSVSDSGMGILPEDLPHLFQKFQRGTGTYLVHTEGTGLGLYVAREMIKIHKGEVWAESKGQGKGSKFFVTIPINTN